MDILLNQTVVFVFILALALLIERLLEVLKSIYDFIDCRMGFDVYWTKKAVRLQQKLEDNIQALERVSPDRIKTLVKQYADKLVGSGDNGVITISGDLLRATTVRFVAKLIAITLGILMALCFGLDLVKIWQDAATIKLPTAGLTLEPVSRQIVTGIALGLGSAPLHKIITTIERQQKQKAAKKSGGANV